MPIEFACESCSRLLRVPDGTSGSQCECPACKTLLVIPDPSELVTHQASSPSDDRLRIPCPECNFILVCERNLLGTKGQCRNCKTIFTISEQPQSVPKEATPGLVFSCPKCNQLFEGREEMRDRKGKCHACGEVFPIELRKATPASAIPKPDSKPASQSPRPSQPGPARSSTIQLACTSCNGVMEVPASAAGQQTACPYCQQLLQIPKAASSKPTPAHQSRRSGSHSPTSQHAPAKSKTPTKQTSAGKPTQKSASVPATRKPSPSARPKQAPAPPPEPQAEDNWLDLGDLSGASLGTPLDDFSQGPNLSNVGFDEFTSEENSFSRGTWSGGGGSGSRRGLTFSNVMDLAFKRAFPSCFAGALVYFATSFVIGIISFGLVMLLGAIIRLGEIRDPTIAISLVGVTYGILALISLMIGAASFAMLCNGALCFIRKKNAEIGEFFSTGEAYMPILVYLFVVTVLSLLIALIPTGLVMLIGPRYAGIGALLGMLIMLPLMLFPLALSLTPFAMLDGESPGEAMGTSLRIFGSNPFAFIGAVLCGALIYLVASLATCGIGSLLMVAFPMYVLAAIYHLASK